ncbi:hypothetical protein HHK36_020420 [Tetracentron sinense]|uniref:Uncharacterized protein n=1 Tax=Tetracentron sinense TaxID=13715 RepID=A0A835D8C6_TETSI|nr:hypothetical protein HHK36_020420 [Tetracentron sinense]
MEARLLSFPCSVATPSQPLRNPNFYLTRNPNLWSRFSCCSTRYRRGSSSDWDSNAETFRTDNFKFDFREDSLRDDDDETGFRSRRKRRNWWSDNSSEMDDWSEILEEASDNFWIFKLMPDRQMSHLAEHASYDTSSCGPALARLDLGLAILVMKTTIYKMLDIN